MRGETHFFAVARSIEVVSSGCCGTSTTTVSTAVIASLLPFAGASISSGSRGSSIAVRAVVAVTLPYFAVARSIEVASSGCCGTSTSNTVVIAIIHAHAGASISSDDCLVADDLLLRASQGSSFTNVIVAVAGPAAALIGADVVLVLLS